MNLAVISDTHLPRGSRVLPDACVERLRAAGIHAAYTLSEIEPDPQRCFDEAATLLEQLGERLARERLLRTDGAETGATS